MALTFRDLLDRLCQMEGVAFTSLTEEKKMLRVSMLNEALRWAWKSDYPLIPLPFTVNAATVAVTNGLIAPSLLGDGTWCALFDVDPRPAGSKAVPVDAIVSHEGVHPVEVYTSVYAFYRIAAPQVTYAEGGEYGTPDDIPDALADIVPLRALSTLFVSMSRWDAVNALRGTYGEPGKQKEALTAALIQSGMVWKGKGLALTPAAVTV